MRLPATFRALALSVVTTLALSGAASAAEVRVMISGGLTAAYKALIPEFERLTGHKVLTAYGPSMGSTVNAIPMRRGARRSRRRPDHGRLRARRSHEARQGDTGQPHRPRQITDRGCGEIRRAEAGHQQCGGDQAHAAGSKNQSPIPTAPAASMSRPKCSTDSASRRP